MNLNKKSLICLLGFGLLICLTLRFLHKPSIKIDSTFYYRIVDADIIEIGNSEHWAFVAVDAVGVPRRHAFASDPKGKNLFSNDSIRIGTNVTKVREGDVIFVWNDQFHLGKIKKEKWEPSD